MPTRENAEPPLFEEGDEGLSARGIMLARLGWLALVLPAFGLFLWSLPARYAKIEELAALLGDPLVQAGITPGFYIGYNLVLEVLFALVFVVVGVVIYRRKPSDPMALFVSLALVLFGVMATGVTDALADTVPPIAPVRETFGFLAYAGLILFFYLFPTGRFLPRWTRYLALLGLLLLGLTYLSPTLTIDWLPSQLVWLVPVGIVVAMYGSAAFAQVLRYFFTPSRVQRKQIKWVVFGSVVALLGAVAVNAPRFLDPGLNLERSATIEALTYSLFRLTTTYLFLILIPISIAVAILRYRLYDIDLIINRTLVYVPLSAILAGTYTASVGLAQRLFVAITGEKSDAAIVLTTLVVASSFTPIKNALQVLVDRRFKEVHDPAKRLKALAKQLEGGVWRVDVGLVTRRLLDEAVSSLGAVGGAIYFIEEGQEKLVHATGDWDESEAWVRVPIEHEGRSLGVLKLGKPKEREGYSKRDYAALEEAAREVAYAVARSSS